MNLNRTNGIASVLSLVFTLTASPDPAFAIYNATAGPVFGWSSGEGNGWFGGWEAGAGYLTARLNLGQTYRGTETYTYLALEPWLYVGATLGVGHGELSGTTAVVGLWEGLPIWTTANCGDGITGKNAKNGLLVSVAAGYRYAGTHEFYITPKVGYTAPLICGP